MPKGMADNVIRRRLEREVEGLYGNEALTEELDDSSAQIFLNWAENRVKSIVHQTAGMDDRTAEEAMYPRLRGLRRISRYVNRLVSGRGESAELVDKIIEQASNVYGDKFTMPDREKLLALLSMPQLETSIFIQSLIHLIEGEEDGSKEEEQSPE